MAKPFNFGEIKLDITAGRERFPHVPEPETPFRIAILGDFSGRANRGLLETGSKLAAGRAVLVDRDNFDQALAKFGVELNLPAAGEDSLRISVRFAELADFHPDRIFERLDVFRRLGEIRGKLANPATFARTAAEIGAGAAAKPVPKPPQAVQEEERAPAPNLGPLISGNLLEQMIEETEGRPTEARPSRAPDELTELVRRIVAPHLVPRPNPRQPELIAQVDEAISSQMRALLHHPDCQALEAAWRAVFFLVRRVETDSRLKLYLVDVSKAELAADLASLEDLRSTGAYKLLVEQTVGTQGAEPWAVLAGNYTLDPDREDAELLGRLAKVASAAGAPFLSAASSRVLGCSSVSETPDPRDWSLPAGTEGRQAWETLRKLPEASYLGLALPRFLLRLPYGKDTEPTEQFDFEEMSTPPAHEDYLWGNPAFACVLLLAEAFSEYGWELRPGVYREVGGLPLHIYKSDGESQVKPCAEVLLTELAAERILEKGLMPLVSLKGQDAVRLVRFESLADPLAPLSGRWS